MRLRSIFIQGKTHMHVMVGGIASLYEEFFVRGLVVFKLRT